MLVYAPKDGKYQYTINVFTDIDCSYCRRLHSEMSQYLQRGIRVRYLFYPRTGKGSLSYIKAVSVWCSKDRHDAMNKAKQGLNIETRTCDNPVDNHMRMAEQLGVTGTPTIILEDGGRLPGYVNAAQLLHSLQQRRAVAQANP
jgi:thiol:disulfide interchange protein DsbC